MKGKNKIAGTITWEDVKQSFKNVSNIEFQIAIIRKIRQMTDDKQMSIFQFFKSCRHIFITFTNLEHLFKSCFVVMNYFTVSYETNRNNNNNTGKGRNKVYSGTEVHSEPFQISKMKLFAKIAYFRKNLHLK